MTRLPPDVAVKELTPSGSTGLGTPRRSLQCQLGQNTSTDAQAQGRWVEEEEKAVRRKLDLRIIPVITALYLFCFIDRYVMYGG